MIICLEIGKIGAREERERKKEAFVFQTVNNLHEILERCIETEAKVN